MSRGKYSPSCPHANDNYDFKYNSLKMLPEPWTPEMAAAGMVYNEKTMFANYDDEGFDSYGYSAFDANGNYVGIGAGVDRLGCTESEYLCMPEDDADLSL
jgi:hypothetical protein